MNISKWSNKEQREEIEWKESTWEKQIVILP